VPTRGLPSGALSPCGVPESPQGLALQPVARRFDLPRRSFDDLVDGVQMDLERTRYETFDELREYCWRVASTVGLICLNIFGCRHPGGREYAMQLGLALQLTNIVRDVKTDFERGRVYLPQDEMRRFQCTEAHLRAGAVTEHLRALLQHQLARAREFYARAAAALPPGESRRLAAAEIMGAIYFGLLRRIESHDYDVFSDVVRVPRPQRAWIAASTWARTRLKAGVDALLAPARTP
jgi:phytoene synthase